MSSSDISMHQVSLAELHSQITEMNTKFGEYMQQMCNHQLQMVEHLEKIRTATVSLEYRAMWSKIEDDELVRQLHNEWSKWDTALDRWFMMRQVEYQRYKWLLRRSRELSAPLKKELDLVWRYLMSVFHMYVREDKNEFLKAIQKAREENKLTDEQYWSAELARHEDKVSVYNQILEASGTVVHEWHAHESTDTGMRLLYETICIKKAVVMPMGTIHASMSPIEEQGPVVGSDAVFVMEDP